MSSPPETAAAVSRWWYGRYLRDDKRRELWTRSSQNKMKLKEKLTALYDAANNKFNDQFGFNIHDATFSKFVDYLYTPKDSSSLAVTRILFGLAMLFDIPDERGGATMDKRWGEPKTCYFPLFPFIQPLAMPYMATVYAALLFGALGIMLGYKYRISAAVFTVCYWYLLLIDKSYWNNHSYLFGLVALLLTCTDAGCYWSIDAYINPSRSKAKVPYWNYFILKYQFFILYFMAGLKKGTAEWLTGYSVQNLSEHWVFEPFKWFLTVPQIDYLIVHWFVFAFDLTVAVWMMCSTTRHVAMVFCAMFHLMNIRLFRIGMFPWVCLATMPLFYPFDWPKKLQVKLYKIRTIICTRITEHTNQECDRQIDDIEIKSDIEEADDNLSKSDKANQDKVDDDFLNKVPDEPIDDKDDKCEFTMKETERSGGDKQYTKQTTGYDRKKVTTYFIIFHVLSQAFLPYSHFITQGYNNWTNGLYGYSWDMMVHTWDTHAVVIQIIDNDKQKEFYIDPYTFAPNERWTRHGDMVHQYARCIKKNLMEDANRFKVNNERVVSENISIYVDVWCSLNGRFTQRIFDPRVDILKTEWGPFEKVSYLMPLLDEALDWREKLERMKQDVHAWNKYSDVIFLADFPGYGQEKYISEDLKNVTLTILEGNVAYQPEVTKLITGNSVMLTSGDRVFVDSGIFHKVLNIGHKPAFYMYTFYNSTEVEENIEDPMLPVLTELYIRLFKMFKFGNIMLQSLFQVYFSFSKCH